MKFYQFLISHPEKGCWDITVEAETEQEAWDAVFNLFPQQEEYEAELFI
jgi:hypothetical protein